jgi:hypothetical protein
MKVRWQKLILTVTFWLSTEICFNLLGIDNVANHSEFISIQKVFYSARDSFFS